MNRDDIIQMAREVADKTKIDPYHPGDPPFIVLTDEELQRFAALVAAHEREACATVCDGNVDAEYATGKVDHNEMSWSQSCAIAIRARGEK